MKIRVTLITENDKHLSIPKERIERLATESWEQVIKMLNELGDDSAYLERCELVEE
jgi:hypothetical protein